MHFQTTHIMFLELPLHFMYLLENTEAMADESVTLSCELSKPGQEVTWLKNNVPLSLGDGCFEGVNKDYSYQLHIAKVTLEDAGEYQIQVGDLECAAQLSVKGSFSSFN